jgi:hypothetical protein
MNFAELKELQDRAARLTPEERLYLIERLAASLRRDQFTDRANQDAGLAEMAADPGVQQELDLWRSGEVHATR